MKFLYILLFIIIITTFFIKILYEEKLLPIFTPILCEYYFSSNKFSPTVNYKIEKIKNKGSKDEVIITVPHNCFKDEQYLNHKCDVIAANIAEYIKEKYNNKKVTIIKSNNDRTIIDDNRANSSIGIEEKKFNHKEIKLPSNNSTLLWSLLVDKIINDKVKYVLDIHSYPNGVLPINNDISFVIFRPKNINKNINNFLNKNYLELKNNNIKILNVCPNNYVNAITEMCNQNNIPSMLIEFNENKNIINIKKDIDIFLKLLQNDLHIN